VEESGSTMTMAQELSRSSFCGEWNGSSLSKSREEHEEASGAAMRMEESGYRKSKI